MPVLLGSLEPLVAVLRAEGYTVVRPTVRDGAILLAEPESAGDLPYGWGVDLAPDGYRLRERDDRAAFVARRGPAGAAGRGAGREAVGRRGGPLPVVWQLHDGLPPVPLCRVWMVHRVVPGGLRPDRRNGGPGRRGLGLAEEAAP